MDDLVDPAVRAAIEHAARNSRARLVRLLAGGNGDVILAEDALATAFERALSAWPTSGIPANPAAWLLTVARNAQRDTWKSADYQASRRWDPSLFESGAAGVVFHEIDPEAIPDRKLALLFVCAHPTIDAAVRTPLMLQVIFGFRTHEIAPALALPSETLMKRLTRAKRRIQDAHIPFIIPDQQAMHERLPPVLEGIYGCFALATSLGQPDAKKSTIDLRHEAWRLATMLASLLENNPKHGGWRPYWPTGYHADYPGARMGMCP